VRITLGQNTSYQVAQPADAIAISLSEDGQTFGASSPSWQLDIYAGTEDGRYYVGTLNTVAAVNGRFLARVVGYAIAPGARSWNLEATGPAAGPAAGGVFYADLRVHPVVSAPAGFGAGVFRVLGRTIINGGIGTETGGDNTAPLANSRTDFTNAIVFTGAFGYNAEPSGEPGTADIWIMFFDSATVPANGTEPTDGLAFQVPPDATFNFVAPGNGIFFRNGLTWAVSTTPDTLTLAVGPAAARVVTLAEW